MPGTVEVSKQRFEELLESEMVHFARALRPHPMTLQQILHLTDPAALRTFLLEELPIRYARRVQLVESLPNWKSYPSMRMIRSLYAEAFRRLRALTQDDNEDTFRRTLQDIKRKNANMLFHVVRGARAVRTNKSFTDDQVNRFLDEFLTARIGTDILSSQYLSITRPDSPTSIINPECDPVTVVRAAANDAATLCRHHYGWSPPIDIVDVGQVRFPFISQYLNYIVFELLKNSLRAVVERYGSRQAAEAYPIRVVICGDQDTVVLRVSDCGGGIPLADMDQVWSYMFTTAKPACEETFLVSTIHADSTKKFCRHGKFAPDTDTLQLKRSMLQIYPKLVTMYRKMSCWSDKHQTFGVSLHNVQAFLQRGHIFDRHMQSDHLPSMAFASHVVERKFQEEVKVFSEHYLIRPQKNTHVYSGAAAVHVLRGSSCALVLPGPRGQGATWEVNSVGNSATDPTSVAMRWI
eukprot:s1869_g12.t1